MTLLELLYATNFVICIVASVQPAKAVRSGFAGYALAVTIGLLLGFASAAAMWWTAMRTAAHPALSKFKVLSALYLISAIIWILITAAASDQIVSLLLRLT